MKTGNTGGEDAEGDPAAGASMEPGHEDREYFWAGVPAQNGGCGLNGARS